MPAPRRTPKVCPVCDADVPPRSLACPDCGADHESGWSKDASAADGLDLPGDDDDFDYDRFIAEEFGQSPRPSGISKWWWIAAIVTVAAFAVGLLQGFF